MILDFTSDVYRRLPAAFLSAMICAATFPATARSQLNDDDGSATKAENTEATPTPKAEWIDLKGGWKAIEFGGEGDVKAADGVIKMGYGDPITGVRWTGPMEPIEGHNQDDAKDEPSESTKSKLPVLPRDNYELRWECRRDSGFDFLCAFTFPVGEQRASLVMGGWGGGITGISSIDGADASDNQTTMFKAFDNDKWYSARVRVDTQKITVWVDDTELFDHPREGHEFDIRFEMDPCLPLGIANFECDSRIRKIQMRRLAANEIPAGDQDQK